MFLKRLCLALLIANGIYFCYAQGWLSMVSGEGAQREPARLSKQINPEVLGVSMAAPLAATTTVAAPATAPCTAQSAAAEQWLVYMGPYATKDLLEKKKAELAKLKVSSTEVSKTSLPRGLTLGNQTHYASESEARAAWQTLQKQGIKTATVILWSAPSKDKAC